MLCYSTTYSNLYISYIPSIDQDGIRYMDLYIYIYMYVCTIVSTWMGLFVFDLYS